MRTTVEDVTETHVTLRVAIDRTVTLSWEEMRRATTGGLPGVAAIYMDLLADAAVLRFMKRQRKQQPRNDT